MKQSSIVLAIIGILIVGLLIFSAYSAFKTPDTSNIGIGANPAKGNPDAKIKIIEFSDFECPACKAGVPVIKALSEEYSGSIAIYYRNFPLTSIHPNAMNAAKAAQAANEQGKFWEYHDLLFANQDKLDRANLGRFAEQLGLDIDRFNSDFDSDKVKAIIKYDQEAANALGVQGTPYFFVNGQLVIGADYNKIKQIIEEELRK